MRHKIGLALGGGGARGSAHFGVLAGLQQLEIVPDLITGTSIGALVGALVARGIEPDLMAHFFRRLNLTSVYMLPGNKPALSSTDKFEQLLEKLIGRPAFDELAIPLAVVATDIKTQKEVIIDEGDVITAVKASMAFPILLPPIEIKGLTLVDGGLVNNVPFDVARARGATFVIAVDLGNAAPYGTTSAVKAAPNSTFFERALLATKQRPLWQMMTAVTDIVTQRSVAARLAITQPDVLLRPAIGTIGLLDFHEFEQGYQVGLDALENEREQLLMSKERFLGDNNNKT